MGELTEHTFAYLLCFFFCGLEVVWKIDPDKQELKVHQHNEAVVTLRSTHSRKQKLLSFWSNLIVNKLWVTSG